MKASTSCTTPCPGLRDKKETAYEATRFAKARNKGDIIEIVDRSTGAKIIMLEAGRTG
jgi:hypothetical protein